MEIERIISVLFAYPTSPSGSQHFCTLRRPIKGINGSRHPNTGSTLREFQRTVLTTTA